MPARCTSWTASNGQRHLLRMATQCRSCSGDHSHWVSALMEGAVFLSPQIGSDIDPVTVGDLDRVFTEKTFGEFLLLGEADRKSVVYGKSGGRGGERDLEH